MENIKMLEKAIKYDSKVKRMGMAIASLAILSVVLIVFVVGGYVKDEIRTVRDADYNNTIMAIQGAYQQAAQNINNAIFDSLNSQGYVSITDGYGKTYKLGVMDE